MEPKLRSPKMREFALQYHKLGHARDAAIAAGYTARSAHTQAHRLLLREDVSLYLEHLSRSHEDENIAQAEEVLEFLTTVMRGNSTISIDGDELANPVSTQERLRAAELLGKRYGLYVERVESSNASHIVVEIDYGEE